MKRGFLNSNKARSTLSFMSLAAEPKPIGAPIPKPLYGVVKNAGLPEGYKLKKLDYKEVDPNVTMYPEDGATCYLYTTQPPISIDATHADYPDGWTQCLILSSSKLKMVTYPGFPAKPPCPIHPIPYEVRSAPGMGLGLYATRNIRSKELIIAERPLVLVAAEMRGPSTPDPSLTPEQCNHIMLAEKEQQVHILLDRMLPQDLADFMALENSHLYDGSGPIMGVIRTNGFGVIDYQSEKNAREGEGICSAVAKILSRANHSCEPNMDRKFDPASLSMQAWAIRDIRKGEALTLAYCNVYLSYERRREELAPYGFACECRKCQRERPSRS